MPARRIGVLGGTFDPIHRGHLVAADEAARRLHLDEVVFAPSGESWHKSTTAAARSADRLAMVQAAIADDPRFRVTTVDIDRGGPTFTVDTLTDLQAEDARAHPQDPAEWVFIAGADALAGFATWRDPEGILERAEVVAVTRPGHAMRIPEPFDQHVTRIEIPALDVSSSEIRRRVAAGESIDDLVPAGVAEIIAERGLYAEPMP